MNSFELKFFHDIYPLIDKIIFKENQIILIPKKSFGAELYNERYKTPIVMDLKYFSKINF